MPAFLFINEHKIGWGKVGELNINCVFALSFFLSVQLSILKPGSKYVFSSDAVQQAVPINSFPLSKQTPLFSFQISSWPSSAEESRTGSLNWGTTWIKVCSHNYSTQPRFSTRCLCKLSDIPIFLSLGKFNSCSSNTNLVHSPGLAHTQWAQLGTLSPMLSFMAKMSHHNSCRLLRHGNAPSELSV